MPRPNYYFASAAATDETQESSEEVSAKTLGGRMVACWKVRRHNIDHAFATCAWALSVLPQVRDDVAERMTPDDRNEIESVILKLHVVPNPNPCKGPEGTPVFRMTEAEIVDLFWDEFMAFQKKKHPFNNEARWNASNAKKGESHLWHEKYSLPYTAVLGFVACRVCSKVCGIGAAERSWGDVKQIKSGKRAHLGSATLEKRAVLFTSARINDARIRREAMEKLDYVGTGGMFGDNDFK